MPTTPTAPPTANPPFNRLLLTGAAGGLGRVLRDSLKPLCNTLRLSDIAEMAPATSTQEELQPCDLSDKQAVHQLVEGVNAIVHFGGVSVERPFEEILGPNICGVFHIYEAARQHGVKRVVFASSNHVIGFYKQDQTLDAHSPKRPDGYYGLSKSYGEDLANFYFDRYGIQTLSIRIGSSFPKPQNRRMMSTWLSFADLTRLIERGLLADDIGHSIAYGMSANKDVWWDNHLAERLGFSPADTSEVFRDEIEAQPRPAPDDPVAVYQGGAFVAQGPFGDK